MPTTITPTTPGHSPKPPRKRAVPNDLSPAERHTLVLGCRDLAYQLAGKAWGRNQWHGLFDLDDLVGEAFVALSYAATIYDPHRINPTSGQPYAFTTLAHIVITHALIGYATREVERDRKRPPHAQLSVWSGDKVPPELLCEDTILAGADARLDRRSTQLKLASRLARLSDTERYVLREHVAQGRTLAEVADDLGMSKERVRQLREDALKVARGARRQKSRDRDRADQERMRILERRQREKVVLDLLAEGKSLAVVGRELGVSKQRVAEIRDHAIADRRKGVLA